MLKNILKSNLIAHFSLSLSNISPQSEWNVNSNAPIKAGLLLKLIKQNTATLSEGLLLVPLKLSVEFWAKGPTRIVEIV